MHRSTKTFEWKIKAISCNYTQLLCGIIACLDDAFSDIFELEASPEEGQSLQQKDKKWGKSLKA